MVSLGCDDQLLHTRPLPQVRRHNIELIPTIESTVERWISAAPSRSIDLRQEVTGIVEIQGRDTFFSRA